MMNWDKYEFLLVVILVIVWKSLLIYSGNNFDELKVLYTWQKQNVYLRRLFFLGPNKQLEIEARNCVYLFISWQALCFPTYSNPVTVFTVCANPKLSNLRIVKGFFLHKNAATISSVL